MNFETDTDTDECLTIPVQKSRKFPLWFIYLLLSNKESYEIPLHYFFLHYFKVQSFEGWAGVEPWVGLNPELLTS